MCRPTSLPFCLALSLLAPACARPARIAPNILLITLDTTRADRIGAYGYRLAQTPRLDALARSGVLFERALAAAPITLPSHTSLMTGSYPFRHGVRNNGAFSLGDTVPTLATRLHEADYHTAAFVSAFVLDRRFGLARGFDVYDDRALLERRGDRTAAAATAWLDAHAADPAPFFVWLHLYDAHDPYDPPPPFRAAFAAQPYDGEIAFDDQLIGSVLDRLDRTGRLSSTIVAAVGDHGEGECCKLGIAVSERTVSRLLRRPRRPPSQTWRPFLTNHLASLVSIDFFTVPTLIEAFPDDTAPRWLLRDRDAIYGDVFRRRVAGMGITEVLSSPSSPWQNPYAERLIGSMRRECLDHIIVLSHAHLRRVLARYVSYYHGSRTHLSLEKDAPTPRRVQAPTEGAVIEWAEVGGLHHRYERRAA